MNGAQVIGAIDRALSQLHRANSLEPSGTPTDIEERGAILALEVLRDELAKLA